MASEFSDAISALSSDVHCGARRLSIGVRMFVCRAAEDYEWANALLRIINFDQAMRSRLADHVLGDLREGLREGIFAYENEGIALDMVVSCTTGAMRSVVEGRSGGARPAGRRDDSPGSGCNTCQGQENRQQTATLVPMSSRPAKVYMGPV